MRDRQRVGGVRFAGRPWRFLALVAVLASIVFTGPRQAEAGRSVSDALNHHATVLNGRVVGSAFMVNDEILVTNRHVARGIKPGGSATLIASESGARATARLVATSPDMDLAVFAAPHGFLRPVGAAAVRPREGLSVISAGVDATGRSWPAPKMALPGEVITPRAHVAAYGPGMVVRLPGVRPGFSGGPLLDRSGALVGMVTAIRPARGTPSMAASGFAPNRLRPAPASEAYVLRAAEIHAEVRRLLIRAGR